MLDIFIEIEINKKFQIKVLIEYYLENNLK